MALVKALLEAISVRPGEDTEKEACCMWVTHILHSEPWNHFVTALEKRLVRKDVMMWCCMHPGPWTQRLGRDVLKAEDEEFVCDWKDVFHASQLSVAGQGGVEVRAPSPGFLADVTMERFSREDFGKAPALDADEDDAELGTWIRAATPFAAPIGVVR